MNKIKIAKELRKIAKDLTAGYKDVKMSQWKPGDILVGLGETNGQSKVIYAKYIGFDENTSILTIDFLNCDKKNYGTKTPDGDDCNSCYIVTPKSSVKMEAGVQIRFGLSTRNSFNIKIKGVTYFFHVWDKKPCYEVVWFD